MLDIPRNIDTTLGYTAGSIDTVDHVAGSIRKPMDDLTFALSRVGVDVVSLTDKQLDLIRQHAAEYGWCEHHRCDFAARQRSRKQYLSPDGVSSAPEWCVVFLSLVQWFRELCAASDFHTRCV